MEFFNNFKSLNSFLEILSKYLNHIVEKSSKNVANQNLIFKHLNFRAENGRSSTVPADYIVDFWRENSNILWLEIKAHYSKSPKIQFWQNPNIFTSFSPKFFWQFFSWNQSCQQLKSPTPQHFHEFSTKKNR